MAVKTLSGVTAPDGSQYITLTDGQGNLITPDSATMGTTAVVGGADKQILFNDGGAMNGSSNFIYTKAGNGTVTLAGDLISKSMRGTAVAFASLPASPIEGMCVGVTDSNTNTWGATVAAGGANHILAYYNGTNWTVAAK